MKTIEFPTPVVVTVPSLREFALEGIAVFCSAIVAIVGFFVKREINRFAEAQAQIESQLKDQEAKIFELGEKIIMQKTEDIRVFGTREEMIRGQTVIEAKLDSVHRRIDEINMILIQELRK